MLLISIGLNLLAAAVFLAPASFLWNRISLHNGKRSCLYLLLSLYLCAVYSLVGMPNVTYVRFELNLNLVPLADFIGDFRSHFLNVLLFVPLGFLLPLCWEIFQSKKNILLCGFGMSLVIELLQIFTFRTTDINDLITNTLGTFLGYLLARLFWKRCPVFEGLGEAAKPGEFYKVCGGTFLVMFFLQPFVFNWLWQLVF